jgi:hypothetical protein
VDRLFDKLIPPTSAANTWLISEHAKQQARHPVTLTQALGVARRQLGKRLVNTPR